LLIHVLNWKKYEHRSEGDGFFAKFALRSKEQLFTGILYLQSAETAKKCMVGGQSLRRSQSFWKGP